MKCFPSCRPMLPVVAVFVLAASIANAADPYWPNFHGPNRDNISRETGLMKSWPDGGPKLVWKAAGIGRGYSGVSIAAGKIFTAGDFEDGEKVIALDFDGKLLWKSANGESWTGAHPGSRTTPTFDDGVLYQMNPTGRIAAYRADSGEELWAVDLRARFGARFGTWALSENVVVDGDLVYCVPGGSKALVVALNKNSGDTVWTNTALAETAAYCSPVLVEHGGVRQLITMSQRSVIGVDVRSGKLLWSHPHVTQHDQNVDRPVYSDGYVFVASGHSGGGRLLKIDADNGGVKQLWWDKELDNCHGGVILLDGRLYGSACRLGGRRTFCVEMLSGKTLYLNRTLDKMSLTSAEGLLYGLTQRGEIYLIAPREDRFDVIGEFRVPRESLDPLYAHPVICGGRLYARRGEFLYAYDIRGE